MNGLDLYLVYNYVLHCDANGFQTAERNGFINQINTWSIANTNYSNKVWVQKGRLGCKLGLKGTPIGTDLDEPLGSTASFKLGSKLGNELNLCAPFRSTLGRELRTILGTTNGSILGDLLGS